jgi:plastocyanin
MNGFRSRILAPLAVPVGAVAVTVVFVFNYSRILLFLEKRSNAGVSTAVAVFAAAAVLFGCAYFASRTEAHRAGLAALGLAAVVLLFGGGYGSGASHAVAKGGGGEGGSGGEVTVGAVEFAFNPNAITLPPGVIKVTLRNDGRSLHTFQFEGATKFKKLEAPPGTTASGAVQLTAGTYTFYCSELGHRGSGMEGKLTIGKPGK